MADSAPVNPVTQALLYVSDIPDEDFNRMISGLANPPFPSRQNDAKVLIQETAPNIPEESVDAIVGFSTAFTGALSRVKDRDGFIESIVNRAKTDHDGEWRADLLARVEALFESPAIVFLGGGDDAIRDNPQSLQGMQLATDLRPISVPRAEAGKYFAILHRLKLEYSTGWTEDSVRTIELVLEQDDLVELAALIESTLDSQISIQQSVTKSGGAIYMPYEREGRESE